MLLWHIVWVGRSPPHAQPTTALDLIGAGPAVHDASVVVRVKGKREWLELDLLLFFAQNALPPVFFFPLNSSNISPGSKLLLPAQTKRAQIPTAWDKDREKGRGRWGVMGCKCFVTWPPWTEGDDVVRACVCRERVCVGCVCLLSSEMYKSPAQCVYLTLFSNGGGGMGGQRRRQKKHETNIWGIW